MPATRLTERQKAEMVERFRGGEAAQPLALAFGCSPNTVSRVVKAALEPAEYERLKEQRPRRSALDSQAAVPATDAAAASTSAAAGPWAESVATDVRKPRPSAAEQEPAVDEQEADDEDGPGVLAIDDADDFVDDDDDPLGEDEGEDPSLFVAVTPLLMRHGEDQSEIRPLPLETADLPASAYMLVDKTVELQARPLSEFTELGRLPQEEQERRALMMFLNPRQAKRLCGRTQRVIKIPDTTLLSRTAPYLLAQGISRVVIEGALFALPGS